MMGWHCISPTHHSSATAPFVCHRTIRLPPHHSSLTAPFRLPPHHSSVTHAHHSSSTPLFFCHHAIHLPPNHSSSTLPFVCHAPFVCLPIDHSSAILSFIYESSFDYSSDKTLVLLWPLWAVLSCSTPTIFGILSCHELGYPIQMQKGVEPPTRYERIAATGEICTLLYRYFPCFGRKGELAKVPEPCNVYFWEAV